MKTIREKLILRNVIILMVVAAALIVWGCSPKSSYRFYATQATSVDAAMKIAGDLYHRGKISEADRETIVKAYNSYKKAFDAAIDEYVAYEKLPDEQKEGAFEKVMVAVDVMNRQLGTLTDILSIWDIQLDL